MGQYWHPQELGWGWSLDIDSALGAPPLTPMMASGPRARACQDLSWAWCTRAPPALPCPSSQPALCFGDLGALSLGRPPGWGGANRKWGHVYNRGSLPHLWEQGSVLGREGTCCRVPRARMAVWEACIEPRATFAEKHWRRPVGPPKPPFRAALLPESQAQSSETEPASPGFLWG